jgi:hypothetical protein
VLEVDAVDQELYLAQRGRRGIREVVTRQHQ